MLEKLLQGFTRRWKKKKKQDNFALEPWSCCSIKQINQKRTLGSILQQFDFAFHSPLTQWLVQTDASPRWWRETHQCHLWHHKGSLARAFWKLGQGALRLLGVHWRNQTRFPPLLIRTAKRMNNAAARCISRARASRGETPLAWNCKLQFTPWGSLFHPSVCVLLQLPPTLQETRTFARFLECKLFATSSNSSWWNELTVRLIHEKGRKRPQQ